MFTVYTLFKFLHIAGAIVWIGGVLTLSVINARLAQTGDRGALAALSSQSGFFGRALIGPAAMLTLIAGFVMVAVLGLGGPLWVVWGLVGVFGSLILGAGFINRTARKLSRLATSEEAGSPRLVSLQRRLAVLNTLNLLLLLSTVWAMVFKPTL